MIYYCCAKRAPHARVPHGFGQGGCREPVRTRRDGYSTDLEPIKQLAEPVPGHASQEVRGTGGYGVEEEFTCVDNVKSHFSVGVRNLWACGCPLYEEQCHSAFR